MVGPPRLVAVAPPCAASDSPGWVFHGDRTIAAVPAVQHRVDGARRTFSVDEVLEAGLHEAEVAPLVARLLRRGGDGCVLAVGESAEAVLGAAGIAALCIEQLLGQLPAETDLMASVVAVDRAGRHSVEVVHDLLLPVAALNSQPTEVRLHTLRTATAVVRSAASCRPPESFLVLTFSVRRPR